MITPAFRRRLASAVLSALIAGSTVVSVVATPSPVSAGNVHYDFTPNSVLSASKLAHEYFLDKHPNPGNTNWVDSTYHVGELEYYKVTGEPSALANTVKWAEHNNWRPYKATDPCATTFADHQSGGQVLFELNSMVGGPPAALECFRQSVLKSVNTRRQGGWWYWSDALYMSPATWASMAQFAASPAEQSAIYESLYTEFDLTRTRLFNTSYNLFARDKGYVYPSRPSPDGSPQFWSRGNGWAFAGLARLLDRLPPNAPHYAEYRDTFVKMAAALKPLQQPSGFWGADLLEPYHINQPETSGTAFFVYGMAIGVRTGILDPAAYMPTIEQGWLALANTSLQDSGLLGWTQNPASNPTMGPATRDSTQPYAVGAFLAASAEIYGLLVEPNVALGKPVACSHEQADWAPCRQAVDGDTNQPWAPNTIPSSIEIDLGAVTDLSALRTTFYSLGDYTFTVAVKLDVDDEYRIVIDQGSDAQNQPELIAFPDGTDARFVRLQLTSGATDAVGWVAVGEVEVFGQPSTFQQLATPNPPTCSDQPQPQFSCNGAVDDGLRNGSRWSAATFPQSISLDLGSPQLISAMALHALYNREYNYRLEVKTNAADAYHVAAEFSTGNGSGAVQSISPIVARYARLTVTGIANRSTNWVSIREWELFGEPASPTRLRPVAYECNNQPQRQFRCGKLFDGSTASTARWSTDGYGVVDVDLGKVKTIRSYALATLADRRYGYKIEALVPPDPRRPNDPEVYVVVEERDGSTARPGVQQVLAQPVNASKIRLSITSFPPGIIPWSSLTEFSLYD